MSQTVLVIGCWIPLPTCWDSWILISAMCELRFGSVVAVSVVFGLCVEMCTQYCGDAFFLCVRVGCVLDVFVLCLGCGWAVALRYSFRVLSSRMAGGSWLLLRSFTGWSVLQRPNILTRF